MKYKLFIILFYSIGVFSQSIFEKGEKAFTDLNLNQAQAFFELFLKENPNHLKTIEYLGDIAGTTKSWDKALNWYRKLKQLMPNEANYHYKYGGALGMKAKQSNKFKALHMINEIKSSFEKAIELNPKHIEARWALIMLYLELPAIIGGSELKAMKYSNELLKLSPIDGYLSKGQIDEYFKRYTAAAQQYKKAIEAGDRKIATQKLDNLYRNKIKSH